MEKLNHEEELGENQNLNPSGDEDLNDEDFDLNLDEEEQEENDNPEQESLKALEIFNKQVGKNYKSWEDVKKSERQRDIEFAKKPQKEEKKEEVIPVSLSERLLRVEQPESKFVIDQIKKDHPGKDPYEIWNTFEFYRKEAETRAEKEKAKERISNPSGVGGGDKDDFETQMSKKFMKNFPPGVVAPNKK